MNRKRKEEKKMAFWPIVVFPILVEVGKHIARTGAKKAVEQAGKEGLEKVKGVLGSARDRFQAKSSTFDVEVFISEDETELIAQMKLHGIDPRSINTSISGNKLTLSTETATNQKIVGEEFTKSETRETAATYEVDLPVGWEFDANRMETRQRRGIFEVRIPRVKKLKKKRTNKKVDPE